VKVAKSLTSTINERRRAGALGGEPHLGDPQAIAWTDDRLLLQTVPAEDVATGTPY